MLDTLPPSARPRAGANLQTALAGYGRVSLEAKVAAASPHQLVQLLYQRLGQLLREAQSAAVANDAARRLKATEKALAIVDGLDGTLDDRRGGSVAAALHEVYALVRSRILSGDAASIGEAATAVGEIGAAWGSIAQGQKAAGG